MQQFDRLVLKKLYIPPADSHKGQNGKLLLVGGSHLFHAASLWALKISSRIVDMVFYASVPENNEIVMQAKKEFHDGIVIPRDHIEDYINEADVVLIGPGMVRTQIINHNLQFTNLSEINNVKDEGEQTYYLINYLLQKYSHKKWVIDAGALQMLSSESLLLLEHAILTPHLQEFEQLKLKIKNEKLKIAMQNAKLEEQVELFAKEYHCIILLKGKSDISCSPKMCIQILGGNAGMTKGGTGDVLAGLIAALACNNDLFLAAQAGAYINKYAGETLFKKVGYYFNSSDLVDEISKTMRDLIVNA